MKNLKPSYRGKILTKLSKQDCSWCRQELDPTPSHICTGCHAKFKLLLSSTRWTRYRHYFLSSHGYCVHCHIATGAVLPAKIVDHIKPWSLFPSLFWEETNHQTLCHPCHTRKTLTDGTVIRFERY